LIIGLVDTVTAGLSKSAMNLSSRPAQLTTVPAVEAVGKPMASNVLEQSGSLSEFWVAVVFGWPAIVLALLLSATGIARGKPLFLGVAVAIMMPFCLYLAATPRGFWIGVAVPFLLLSAAFAVRRRRSEIAWCLFAPVVAAFFWLAMVVMQQ